MATIMPDELLQRARRAYERGRLRHAAAAAWLALLLTVASCVACHELGLSLAIGCGLFALATGLLWRGGTVAYAAKAGLKAGAAAFAVPVAAFHMHSHAYCPGLPEILAVDGLAGIGAGVMLSLESARRPVQRNLFLVSGIAVASLAGMLGCLLFGPAGLAGMLAGALLSSAPVAILRRASA